MYSTNNLIQVVRGDRLADIHILVDAIQNNNGANSASQLVATGTTASTALLLTSVYNQIDTVPASTGVMLPSTRGKSTTPYQYCLIINNGANNLTVYGNGDTINNTAATTGVSQSSGTAALYVSAEKGSWFSLSGGGGGGVSRAIYSVSTNTNATAGEDLVYICSGTMTLTLPTAVGNTNLYSVKNTNASTQQGSITIATTGGQTIDTESTALLYVPYSSYNIISDGSNWWIV